MAPLFFIVVLAATQLFVWSYDKQVLARSVRVGASAGNEAMAPINFRFAFDPHLATVFLPNVNEVVFADLTPGSRSCREAANAAPASNRLSWDWGCIYDISSGGATGRGFGPGAGDKARALQTPLDTALTRAYKELSGFYVGPEQSGTISACYAIWNAAAASPVCVLERLGTFANNLSGGLALSWGINTINPASTPAPSFLVVKAQIQTIKIDTSSSILGFLASTVTLNATTVQVLNRYVSSCMAPASVSDYTAGGCGSAY